MSNFLDETGLAYFWNKIKTLLNGKLGVSETAHKTASIPMGQVDSTSTATVFTATVSGITELRDGVCMWLKNGVVTSASGFTININNLGAKPVYSNLAAASRSTTIFNINYTMLFVYNSTRVSGGCWDIVYGYDSNTNTIGYQVRHNSGTGKASDKTYRYRLLFTGDEDTLIPATTSSSSNATDSRAVNQRPIDPFGPIYYYGSTTTVNAGASFGATNLWQQYAVTLGYSFNTAGAALTLAYPKAVYVKATPTGNGKAIINSVTPYVQDLPTVYTDDSIYIYLGQAYSETNIELSLDHPVYQYRAGAGICLYTGELIGDNTSLTTTAKTIVGAINEVKNTLDARDERICGGTLAEQKALATTFGIIPVDTLYFDGSDFTVTSDGGYKCNFTGTVLASAYCYITGLNAGDTVVISVGRYNSGWVWTSDSIIVVGGTERSGAIANMPIAVSSNDILYLRARNVTAARGTVTSARLITEFKKHTVRATEPSEPVF